MRESKIIQQTSNQPITIESLMADLSALGVEPGMTLLVHSSLSALGWVCGGPVAVILALENLLGPAGTLVMPTHTNYLSDPANWHYPPVPQTWWETIRQTMPPYRADLTPSRGMGVIPETFRKQAGVQRSPHPHFSFAAWGAQAEMLTRHHPVEFGLGETSPLARIYDLDGWILLLGVGHDNNTSLHLAEYRADFPGKRLVEVGMPLMVDNRAQWVEVPDIDLDNADFDKIGADFIAETPYVRQGLVGQAAAQLMPQRRLVDFAGPWLLRHRRPPAKSNPIFEKLVAEALKQNFSGWDFSFIERRWVEDPPSWDYRARVQAQIPHVNSLLDLGTGGGEFLASLGTLPPNTWATEGYYPNVPLAKNRLTPRQVRVLESEDDHKLPFEASSFDLVISRHNTFAAAEIARILKPNGLFITQQVGGADNLQLNAMLQAIPNPEFTDWTLQTAINQLTAAEFEIVEQYEEFPETTFYDIGAVVYYLKAIPWQIPGFNLADYYDRLLTLHQTIQANGGVTVSSHRFFIVARKYSKKE